MTKIIPKEIQYNSFDAPTFKKIKALLESIPSEHYQRRLFNTIKDIIIFNTDLKKQNMIWIIGQDPSYFVQAKKDSSAIIRIQETSIIVYSPKFLEYPQIAHIPIFKQEITNTPYKVTKVQSGPKMTVQCQKIISNYILAYYTNLHSKSQNNNTYEQELITNLKHKISKESGNLYWHLILDTKNTQISFLEEMDSRLIYRIEGPKVDKYIYMFSQKGVNIPITKIVKNKWKQIISFILLLALLMTVVMCPQGKQDQPAYCASKSTIFYSIGGFFMIMVGMKLASKKKMKLPGANKGASSPNKQNQNISSSIENISNSKQQ